MKTTIELPDDLAAEAKSTARSQHTSLRELMLTGLRAEIDRRQAIGPVDFKFRTVGGDGLVADLSPADVIRRSYDLPDEQ